jgi:hypothetical protein
MRPSVPTYHELSVTQLAHFRALRPHSLHSKFSLTERIRLACVFRTTPFRLSQLFVFIANHITTPFHFTSAFFLRLLQDADSLCGSGPVTHTTRSICHGGLHHRLRHSRLIAGTDGRVGRVGGGSGKNWLGIQAYGRQASHGVGSIFDSAPMRKCLNITRLARGSMELA